MIRLTNEMDLINDIYGAVINIQENNKMTKAIIKDLAGIISERLGVKPEASLYSFIDDNEVKIERLDQLILMLDDVRNGAELTVINPIREV